MLKVYGIKNCGTMKKAFAWLEENGVEYMFHDYKKLGLDDALLSAWMDQVDWNELLNKKGMTWRKLDDAVKSSITKEKAVEIMLDNQSIIRRPLLEKEGKVLTLGFDEAVYKDLF